MQMKEILAKVDLVKTAKNVRLGSIIFTKKVNYFLSISAGQLVVADKIYFAVSVSSPIGKLLLGKQENEEITFNGMLYKVQKIV
jgi:hypothetical protein